MPTVGKPVSKLLIPSAERSVAGT